MQELTKQQKELTTRQRVFADNILSGETNYDSAIAADCPAKSAAVTANKWLKMANVQQYIDKARAKTSKKFEIPRESLIQDLINYKELALVPRGENGNIELRSAISATQEQAKLLGLYAPEEKKIKITEIAQDFGEGTEDL